MVKSGECEDLREEMKPSERYPGAPTVAFDPTASGGSFVRMSGSRPALLIPIAPKKEGFYALTLWGRGELGGGTFPSLLIARGEKRNKLTTARVTGSQWQSIPGGHAFRLEAGQDFLVVELGNELRLKDVPNRTLDLDRFELRYLGSRRPGSNLRIHFAGDLAPELMNGPVTLRALAFRADGKPAPADTRVGLWVNGAEVAHGKGGEPTFPLLPSQLRHGENTIELQARRPGEPVVKSGTRMLRVPDEANLEPPRIDLAITRDLTFLPDWKMNRGAFSRENVVSFNSESDVTIPLPADVVGEVEFAIEIEGDHYKGPPRARIDLLCGSSAWSKQARARSGAGRTGCG